MNDARPSKWEGWRKWSFVLAVLATSVWVTLASADPTATPPVPPNVPDGWNTLVLGLAGLFLTGNVAHHYVKHKHNNGVDDE